MLLARGVEGVGLPILVVVELRISRQRAKRPLRAGVGHPRHDLIIEIALDLPLLKQLLNLLIVQPIINMQVCLAVDGLRLLLPAVWHGAHC